MEVISFGRSRKDEERDRRLDIIIAFCRSRKRCRAGDGRACPLLGLCGSRPLGEGITSFSDGEIQDALRLIASDAGKRK